MATARQIINPNNAGSIKFAASEAGLDAGVEQGFQIMDWKLVAKPNVANAPGTYGAPPVDVPGVTSYTLVIQFLQDWGLDANALAEYLFAQDGNEVWYRLDPSATTAAGVKGMSGKCYIVAPDYGGPAGGNWVATVNLPCSMKPQLLTAT